MMQLVYIAMGGMLGTVLRHLVIDWFVPKSGTFPWGTLAVNLAGSLLAGVCFGVFDTSKIALEYKLMVMIGFLGAFTTFSTFSLENCHLLRSGQWGAASLNILISNVLGIVFVFLGFGLAVWFLGPRTTGS